MNKSENGTLFAFDQNGRKEFLFQFFSFLFIYLFIYLFYFIFFFL